MTSVDFDRHPHPRVDATLKMMLALSQTRDPQLAALQDSSACDRDAAKAGRALGHCCLSSIEASYETTSKIRHRGEGVRLAALVDDN
jgi:hypothetical protein